ncbi:hypothetical protein KO317_00450 [Candidatus Micrarchaeota archaeon]|jgi:hypothetical protein|nr:hypothetical protein [Candidatus Micrarchaeota archaeon]
MVIPKVKFIVCPLDESIDVINTFLNFENTTKWSKTIFTVYPQLKNELKDCRTKKERKKVVSSFFTNEFHKNSSLLNKKIMIFQKEWDKINDEIMIAFSEIIETNWLREDKIIQARISLNPICQDI